MFTRPQIIQMDGALRGKAQVSRTSFCEPFHHITHHYSLHRPMCSRVTGTSQMPRGDINTGIGGEMFMTTIQRTFSPLFGDKPRLFSLPLHKLRIHLVVFFSFNLNVQYRK